MKHLDFQVFSSFPAMSFTAKNFLVPIHFSFIWTIQEKLFVCALLGLKQSHWSVKFPINSEEGMSQSNYWKHPLILEDNNN